MVLSAQEESLLPPEEASNVMDWARQFADLADERAIASR
jgi:hypothetical protein